MKKFFILLSILFATSLFSQEVSFETLTQALNYNGDKNAVKKLTIWGNISDAEWSQFRGLNNTFSTLEEVELLTSQDIPDYGGGTQGGKKYGIFELIMWLKKISLPNTKYIGFGSFVNCYGLKSVSLGTGFTSPTDISIAGSYSTGYTSGIILNDVFSSNITKNIDLILGQYAFPTRDTTDRTWYGYVWKSINPTDIVAYSVKIRLLPKADNIVTVTEYGAYLPGTECTLTAIPGEKYKFVKFTNLYGSTELSTSTPYTFIPTQNTAISAHFEEIIGVDDIENVDNFTLSPNPVTTSVTLTLNLKNPGDIVITLNDLLGSEVMQIYNEFADVGTFTKTFSLGTLPKGVYYVKIISNGQIKAEKLVKI